MIDRQEAKRRFKNLPPEAQLRVLAMFGYNLTIAGRDAYEFQASGVREPRRLRDINEIQHRIFSHIAALASGSGWRYPDEDLLSIVFDFGDERLREQTIWALEDAFARAAD